MKKYKNLMWACLASLAIPAGAQDADNNIRGMVVDKWGASGLWCFCHGEGYAGN